jgi:pilus assembly protein Flp/PilA
MTMLKAFVREEAGVDLVEYAFIAGLVAFGCVVGMGILTGGLDTLFGKVTSTLDGMLR